MEKIYLSLNTHFALELACKFIINFFLKHIERYIEKGDSRERKSETKHAKELNVFFFEGIQFPSQFKFLYFFFCILEIEK